MKKFKYIKSDQKGLTLIEVLLAFTILSIIFATVVPFLISAVKNNKMVETSHQSIYFAKEELTTIQNNAEIQSFLRAIQNVQPTEIPKTSYPHLNLLSNIKTVQLEEKKSDTDPVILANYYVLEIKEGPLKMEVFIRSNADYMGKPKLYRTIIHVYDENNKLLTKSFGYIKYKP